MMSTRQTPGIKGYSLVVLIVAQAAFAAYFLLDIGNDVSDAGGVSAAPWNSWAELAANLGLIAGIAVETGVLLRLMRRQADDARALSIASGALHGLIEGWFADWGLTSAEADVAMFTFKGFSIAEIARFRGCAEATVKTHLAAIYRKSGVSGRSQLTSMLVEDLLGRPPIDGLPLMAAKAAGPA